MQPFFKSIGNRSSNRARPGRDGVVGRKPLIRQGPNVGAKITGEAQPAHSLLDGDRTYWPGARQRTLIAYHIHAAPFLWFRYSYGSLFRCQQMHETYQRQKVNRQLYLHSSFDQVTPSNPRTCLLLFSITLSVCSETSCTYLVAIVKPTWPEKSLNCKWISRPRCHRGSGSAQSVETCPLRHMDSNLLH